MEGSILTLLARHHSLAYTQIAAELDERPEEVRVELARLRDLGLVEALTVGKLVGTRTDAASYWSITDSGKAALPRKQ